MYLKCTFVTQKNHVCLLSAQESTNVLLDTLAMTLWCVSVIPATVTVLAQSPCLHWGSTPPTWAAGQAAGWSPARVTSRWTAVEQVSHVAFFWVSSGVGAGDFCLWVSFSDLRLTIVPYQKYQKIRGFGGALTDAAAINILSLSDGAQNQLLKEYFSSEGSSWGVTVCECRKITFDIKAYISRI